MDIRVILLLVHLVGFALGLGGATVSDVMFFRSLKDKKISEEEYATLKVLSKIIWVGLFLLVSSGAWIFFEIFKDNNNSLPLLYSARWQTKLTLVAIVLINGLVFLKGIFPILKESVGRQLSAASLGGKLWALAISGTISIVSWYSITIIMALPRTIKVTYGEFMLVYAVLILGGVIVSRFVLGKRLS